MRQWVVENSAQDTEVERTVDDVEDAPVPQPDELRLLVTEYATLREIWSGILILGQTSASRREDVEFLRDLGLIEGQGQSVVLSDSGRRLLELEPVRQSEMVLGFDRTMLGF